MAARRWTHKKDRFITPQEKKGFFFFLERDECTAAGFSHEPPLILLHVYNEKIPAYTYL